MNRDELRTELIGLAGEFSGRPAQSGSIGDDTRLDDLDSLDWMAFAVEIHERYGATLEVADVAGDPSLGTLIDVVIGRMAASPSTNRAA